MSKATQASFPRLLLPLGTARGGVVGVGVDFKCEGA